MTKLEAAGGEGEKRTEEAEEKKSIPLCSSSGLSAICFSENSLTTLIRLAKVPKPNKLVRISFCLFGICNFHNNGMGTIASTRSERILIPALTKVMMFLSMQTPLGARSRRTTSHHRLMGQHVKNVPRTVQRP